MRRLTLVLLVLVLFTLTVGCTSAEMTYVTDGGTYTAATVEDLATKIPDPSFADTRPDSVSEIRTTQLTALRSEGGDAATLADILTGDFPADPPSVPYYAEEAVVDGQDVWVVLEVWSASGDMLDKQRMWVLTRDEGNIVLSSVYN